MKNSNKYVVKYVIAFNNKEDYEKLEEEEKILENEIEFTDDDLLIAREKAFDEAKKIEKYYEQEEFCYKYGEVPEDLPNKWRFYVVNISLIYDDIEYCIYHCGSSVTDFCGIFKNLLNEYAVLNKLKYNLSRKEEKVDYIDEKNEMKKGTILSNEMDWNEYWEDGKINLYIDWDSFSLDDSEHKPHRRAGGNDEPKTHGYKDKVSEGDIITPKENNHILNYKTNFKCKSKNKFDTIEFTIKTASGMIPEEIQIGIMELLKKCQNQK